MSKDEPIDFSKALWSLRQVKAMREVRNGKQKKIQDPFDCAKRKG
jgi:hypothetical protein